ncbi:MFS transporter [Arsenophonus apicola]|uniref:MFS transporter n=1 Tax=Arsenophonus apicola TaxID=2879119 RepID=UPI003879E88F
MKKINRQNLAFFTFGLALLTMMGILGVDTYLPSIPDIAKEFNKSLSSTQLSIMAYTLAIGLGQLIFGPLSDAIGRRRIMLTGAAIYAATTFMLTQTESLPAFLVIRVIQGLSISITLVTSVSAVRDVSRGTVAALLYSIIITIEGFVPIASPLIGGFINDLWGWRSIFGLIFIYALITIVYVFFAFPETLSVKKRTTFSWRKTSNIYQYIACQPKFYLPCLSLGLSFSLIYCYVTAAPFIFMIKFGASASIFGIYSAIIGLFLLAGAFLSSKLLRKFSATKILSIWLRSLQILIIVFIPIFIYQNNTITFFAFFAIFMFTGGLFESLYTYLTMSSQKNSLGATSALMGSASLVIPSMIGGIGSFFIEMNLYLWMVYILILVTCMALMLTKYQKL